MVDAFKKLHSFFEARIELTYSCNFNCIHCFVKVKRCRTDELGFREWIVLLNKFYSSAVFPITFTGGEPFLRKDFLKIYAYAKKKGFLISIYTNGSLLHKEILNYLDKYPPHYMEITLNSITEPNFDKITRTKGNFKKVLWVIEECVKRNLPLVIKSNVLRENKNELINIKNFAQQLLGGRRRRYRFVYDPILLPRLDGNCDVLQHRLSPRELIWLIKSDNDLYFEYKNNILRSLNSTNIKSFPLYSCNSYKKVFNISPYGELQFCPLFKKFSVDLKRVDFLKVFPKYVPELDKIAFKSNSKCKNCNIKNLCHNCPAKAFLETKDEESPVQYYCTLAKLSLKECKR